MLGRDIGTSSSQFGVYVSVAKCIPAQLLISVGGSSCAEAANVARRSDRQGHLPSPKWFVASHVRSTATEGPKPRDLFCCATCGLKTTSHSLPL